MGLGKGDSAAATPSYQGYDKLKRKYALIPYMYIGTCRLILNQHMTQYKEFEIRWIK